MRNNLDPFKVGILDFILYYYLNRDATIMNMVRCYGNAWNKRNKDKLRMVFEKSKQFISHFYSTFESSLWIYFLGYNNLNVSSFCLARHGHWLTWNSKPIKPACPWASDSSPSTWVIGDVHCHVQISIYAFLILQP